VGGATYFVLEPLESYVVVLLGLSDIGGVSDFFFISLLDFFFFSLLGRRVLEIGSS
jgi:hypothetical protein